MPDAVKVGFVPFSSAPRGILVVFCDDALKFGPATSKALGPAAAMIKRAAAANQFMNWLAAAARLIMAAAGPSALLVAGPNFSASSQNTTRISRGALENGTKPTLTASGIGYPPKSGL